MRKLTLAFSLSIFMVLIISTEVNAVMPFNPDDIERMQKDGTLQKYTQEWIDFKNANPPHNYDSDDLILRPQKIKKIAEVLRGDILQNHGGIELDGNDVIDERDFLELGYPVERNAQNYQAPSLGEQKSIVILVDFNDRQGSVDHDPAYFNDMLFTNEGRSNPSLRDYFHEVSNGLLDCVGTVADSEENAGYFRIDANASEYFGYDNNRLLVERAVELADPYVDFSEFDTDGNRVVDSLMVVVAGPEEAGEFWPHKWYLQSLMEVDGVFVYPYFMVAEETKVGTFAHEHGHAMGLPDLYDYDYSSFGVGYWCLMGYGGWGGGGNVPVHPNGWCKAMLGWVDVFEIEDTFVNAPIVGTPDTEMVYKFYGTMFGDHEYFIIENRRKVSYDRKLPGEGVLIWHINLWGQQDNDNIRKVDLEEADGRDDMDHKENRGDVDDPFFFESGNFSFTKDTYPNSNDYLGYDSGISVLDISIQGQIMYALIKNKPISLIVIDEVELLGNQP